jgi:DNA repair exonuclease SbcCD ATPase subunit
VVYSLIRLLGLIFLISTSYSCKQKQNSEEHMQDRIKLTRYKKQIEEIYRMQNAIKEKTPALIERLKQANTPRQKGSVVTRIQRNEKKIRRFKDKINVLKKKIIELEQKGVKPID